MSVAQCIRRGALAGVALSLGVMTLATGALGQTTSGAATAPEPLLPRKPVAAQTAPKPVVPHPAKPVATKPAKPAATATATAPVPTGGTGKADAKKPAKAAGKPGAGPVDTAQKVSPAARRAAALAALTAQATPPVHDHVSLPAPATACANPDAIGVSRVIEVDTTGGLYVGQRYMNSKLPLEPKEVVLTFDDGPIPRNTDRVLEALAHECTKATFFIVGAMAKSHPEALRRIAVAGHSVGHHTMTHPLDMVKRPVEWGKDNIASGWKTVDQILYGKAEERPATPFFRYPGLFNSNGINTWLNSLDVGVFAIDAAGNDWLKGYLTATDAPNVMNEALKELEKTNGGVLLLHDIKESSSRAVAPLLVELKARGFKIVHIVPKKAPPPLTEQIITGSTRPAAAEPVPVPQRTLAGFDTTQQLAQEARGFKGTLPAEPVRVVPVVVQVAAAAPMPRAPEVGRSIADVIGPDSEADTPITAVVPTAATPAADASWLGSTGRAFRGIASAIGIW